MIWKLTLPNRIASAALRLLALAACAVSLVSRAAGQTPPEKLTRSQIHLYNSESEVVEGGFPGLLLVPNARPNYRDEKYQQPYHLACHVYTAVPSPDGGSEPIYLRRFLVCAAD